MKVSFGSSPFAALITLLCAIPAGGFAQPDDAKGTKAGSTASGATHASAAESADAAGPKAPDDAQALKFVAAPIPMLNPQLDFGLGAIAMLVYPIDADDTESPPSSTVLFGLGTTNGSYMFGAGQQVHLSHDDWRMRLLAGYGKFNSDYYGSGDATAWGITLPLGSASFFVQPLVLRRTVGALYVGLAYTLMASDVNLDAPVGQVPKVAEQLFPIKVDQTNSGLGLAVQFDTRDSQFSATSGFFVELHATLFNGVFGGDADFLSVDVQANAYTSITDPRYVAAFRVALSGVSDGAPFYLLPSIGGGADLRGYGYGTYRDQYWVAGQAEFRWNFWWRLHAVAFLGLGTVTGPATSKPPALPSYGGGLRFRVDDEQRLMLRMDVGAGLGSPFLYMGINEAF